MTGFHLVCSLFILSNETVNIWSHLLGFLLFFCVGVYNMASVLPSVGASREDYVIYSIALFCFQVLDSGFSRIQTLKTSVLIKASQLTEHTPATLVQPLLPKRFTLNNASWFQAHQGFFLF